MQTTLLKIRFIQFRREWQTLGWWHKGLFLVILGLLLTGLFNAFQNSPACWYVLGILWATALAMQLFRKDKHFVFLHLANPRKAVFFQYAGMGLPFILPALFTSNWYCFFLFPVGLLPILWVRYTVIATARFGFLSRILPAEAFEWIAGFRQHLFLLVPIYVLALAFCWVKMLPIALLWLFCGILLGFYQQSEPLHLLRITAISPEALIKRKIKIMAKLLFLICVPVILLQTIFHPWLGLAGLGFLLLQFCVLAFAILMKYSTYVPNQTQHSNMLLLSFAQISVVLPFFLLLPLVLVFRQYRRARRNLQIYLPPC